MSMMMSVSAEEIGSRRSRRPQYRVLASLLRQTTAELLLRGLDENGIRLPGTERRRQRLVNRVLPIVEKLNALGIGLGNRSHRPKGPGGI
jgi:hypothetical protein